MKQNSKSRRRGTSIETRELEKEIATATIKVASSYEAQLALLSDRLLRLANSLRYPCNHMHPARTDTWWQVYVASAARELIDIADDLPGPCVSTVEFEDDLPRAVDTQLRR